MPAKSPQASPTTADNLSAIGAQIRAQRKALHISATVAAEAAGMSRITLHRIENGEPSVTMGAYLNALAALGMALSINPPNAPAHHAPADVVRATPANQAGVTGCSA